MSFKSSIVAVVAFATVAAFAQQRLGTVDDVQGVVTVTTGATGGTATKGSPIVSGMRFVTSSGGSALLKFNNGCEIHLKPSQAVTVVGSMTCEALLAAVQSMSTNVADGSIVTGAAATAGLVAGSIGLSRAITPKSISSN